MSWILSPQAHAAEARTGYIVVLKDAVDAPATVARAQAGQRNARLSYIYDGVIKGYAAALTPRQAAALARNPKVKYVEKDSPIELHAQEIPTGIDRTYASSVAALDIDGEDDVRVDADVAVIDSGVDLEHEDLNLYANEDPEATYAWVNCLEADPVDEDPENDDCEEERGSDGLGHGTHVAGSIGAIDNDKGVVGVAPGVRLWSAKVFDENGSGGPTGVSSAVLAALLWVDEHADEIEVANMSLGGKAENKAWEESIAGLVDKGIVFTVSAGNQSDDAGEYTPAKFDDVITVSALADYNGLPGGGAPQSCDQKEKLGNDDTLARFSNWGSVVDLAAPGTCILSTLPTEGSLHGKDYGYVSGTSMAAPHVAGAAAFMASEDNPNSREDVEAIRQTLIDEGSLYWTDASEDGMQEPLLDLRPPALDAITTDASGLRTNSAKLNGIVNPGGLETDYWFEYGETTSYGQSVPVSAEPVDNGTSDIKVSQTIAVEPETTYHYRVAVEAGGEVLYGEDLTFKTPRWSIQSSPLPSEEEGKHAETFGVSCSSPTWCVGVGRIYVGSGGVIYRAFAERYDGGQWSIASVPMPSEAVDGGLEDVSCVSTAACMAVGWFKESGGSRQALVEQWNGSEWSVLSTPTPSGTTGNVELQGVSCLSSTSCIAVGNHFTGESFPLSKWETKTLVEVWDGSEWTVQSPPNLEGKELNALTAVSCSSASACTAVGYAKTPYAFESADYTMITERWDGSSWSLQSAPNPSEKEESALEDVSCSSASFCMAVGNTEGETNLESSSTGFTTAWDGSEWQVLSSDLPKALHGVSCASAEACEAGGQSMGRHWDGAEWSAVDFALPPNGSQVELEDISCVSGSVCVAAGHFYFENFKTSGTRVLAERLTPPWSPQTTFAPEPREEAMLDAVSCTSTTMCMAAGNDDFTGKSFAELWDGSEWDLLFSDLPGGAQGVSCGSATSCMVVGVAGGEAFTERLNQIFGVWGHTAKQVATPEGGAEVRLLDVSCTSASACTAVGSYFAEGKVRTLAERWDGSEWTVQSTPTPEGSNAELLGVSCDGASSCTAVGKQGTSTLAMRWNGTSWSTSASVDPSGATESALTGVSCPSSGSCMAVGWFKESAVWKQPLAESWDGSSWSEEEAAVPAEADGHVTFSGVACSAATACSAVGSYGTEKSLIVNKKADTLAEVWDGSEWSPQPSPNTEEDINQFAAVSCTSSTACTAVGSGIGEGGHSVTLAGRYE